MLLVYLLHLVKRKPGIVASILSILIILCIDVETSFVHTGIELA